MRKITMLPLAALIMLVVVIFLAAVSEQSQTTTRSTELARTGLRDLIGLPSIAIGTGYGATRNPLLEIYCTSLYDLPGGYCYIVTASFIDTPLRDPRYFKTVPGFNMTAYKG